MVYNWKREMAVDAQSAGEFLEELENKNGKVTPKLVLDASRQESDLLHPCFEWNDGVAAEKYRESQAGYLIRNLVVVSVDAPEAQEQKVVRAYVNVAENSKSAGSFVAVNTAMNNQEMRSRVLKHALEDLLAFQKKYSDLSELADIFTGIDKLKDELGK